MTHREQRGPRRRQLPGPVQQQAQRHGEERRRDQHAGARRLAAEVIQPPGDDAVDRIADSGQQHDDLRQRLAAQLVQRLGPDQHDDAGEAQDAAQDLAPAQRLLAHEQMGQQDGVERHRRHQDRRQPAVDMGLAPADHDKGQHGAEAAHDQQRPPVSPQRPQILAAAGGDGGQDHAADDNADRGHGHRRDVGHRHLDEQERAAPDRTQQQQQPIVAAMSVHGLGRSVGASLSAGRPAPLAASGRSRPAPARSGSCRW